MSIWRILILPCLLGMLPLSTGSARAVSLQETVFVDLVVNGQHRNAIVELRLDDDSMTIPAQTLREAGVPVEGDSPIDLERAGFEPAYDPLNQRLRLTIPIDLLPTSRRSGPARERVLARAAPGAVFNYDLFAQTSGPVTSVSLWSEQRVFGPFGNIANIGVARATIGGPRSQGTPGYLRYDTRFRHIDTDRALAITAGDLITGGLAWTRPLRLGGIQIGRNFRSRPDLITAPLPSFAGEAAVPSAVDLFIDGQRAQRQTVEPGRFVLDNMAVISGAGVATVVTTDAVGRQITTSIPFYVAPDLLRPGLTDFSAELGFVRRRYGVASFDYGPAAASGFVRRGLSARLTLEGHGELSGRSQTAGIGAVWMPGLFGTLHASVTASRADTPGDSLSGSQIAVGYQYAGNRWSLVAEHRRASKDFRSLADFDLRNFSPGGSSSRAVASVSLDRLGNIGIGYLDFGPRIGPRTQVVTASWSLPVDARIAAFFTADYDPRRNTASAQLRVSFAFGSGNASVGVSRDRLRGFVTQAEASRPTPLAGGIGGAAGLAIDQRGAVYGQGSLVARTAAMQMTAGASVANGRSAAWAGASGSVIWLDGGFFTANDTSDAFAVVSTGGVGGVPVHYENQLIGVTDRRGHALIPRVPAYHPASFTIDPMGLGAGLIPQAVERRVAIAEGSAAVIDMPIRALRSMTLGLVDADGAALAAGSIALLADGSRTVVGWDGIVYVEDVALADRIVVTDADGNTCTARVAGSAGTVSLDHRQGVPCT